MPPDKANQTKESYIYTFDDGSTTVVKMRKQAGDPAQNPISPVKGKAAVSQKKLRKIGLKYIEAGTVYRKQVVICGEDNPRFLGSINTLQIGSTLWTIVGRVGEDNY